MLLIFKKIIVYDDIVSNKEVLDAVGIMFRYCGKLLVVREKIKLYKTSSLFLSKIWCSVILVCLGSPSREKT